MRKKVRNFFRNDFQQGRKYLTKILLVLLCLLMGILLPFSFLLQHRANQYIRQSIDDSNQLFLHQIKNDYTIFRENISALCLSTFYDQELQEIMYNTEPNYADIYYHIRRLRSTLLSSQPSVYSVDIYNAKEGALYTTRSDGVDTKEEYKAFLEETMDLKKLTPILRKINVGKNKDAYTYVFSYFMYDINDPKTMNGSFVVINQSASWFIDALTQVTNSVYDTSVFVVNTSEMLLPYNSTSNELENELLWECVDKIKNKEIDADFGNYIAKSKSGKYLVSYISMDGSEDVIVLLQNYGQVFASMLRMRNEFVVLILMCFFLGLGVVVILSRRLYKPIEELSTYAMSLDNTDQNEILSVYGDELSQIQGILEHYKMKSQEVERQNGLQGIALKRMMISTLLHKSSESNWQTFRRILPDSPLSAQNEWNLYIAIVKVNEKEDDGIFELTSEDEDIILAGIYNIFLESLESGVVERSKQRPWENIYILNVPECESKNIAQYFTTLVSKTREKVNVDITVSYSSLGSTVYVLSKLHKEAQRYLRYQFLFPNECVLCREKCEANEANSKTMYSQRIEKKLLDDIRTGNMEKVRETLRQIQGEIQNLKYEYVLTNVIELITKIKMCIGERNDIKQSTTFANLYPEMLRASSLQGIFISIEENLAKAIQIEVNRDAFMDTENQQFVEKIRVYIETNYADENLSLQTVAEHMKMSARYVSKKFKQHTDLFINDYILSYRMQKAAELLMKTDASVEQIAGQIGIANSNYFYRLFKNHFGCTPRDFVRQAKMIN